MDTTSMKMLGNAFVHLLVISTLYHWYSCALPHQTAMKMKLGVVLLFVVFGWSSWLDVNGLMVELPLMINRLPEGWNLPAYLAVISQLANIGPVVYGVSMFALKKYRTGTVRKDADVLETGFIFTIIIVGILASVLLSFFWMQTSLIGGVEHSTVLLILVFFLSLVDCTSSVTFLPFLARFNASYITAFYVGEGMSGLLPTALAFIQGSGEYTCVNTSTNGTFSILPEYKPLLFPVRDFFIALSVMLLMSLIAFSLLKYSSYCNTFVNKIDHYDYSMLPKNGCDWDSAHMSSDVNDDITSSTPILHGHQADSPTGHQTDSLTSTQYLSLLCVITFVCTLANGVLPSIQIYSLLPYGQIYYSLTMKSSSIAVTLAYLLGFCAFPLSFRAVGILTAVVTAISVYILVIASYSPAPPVEGVVAAVFMVVIWLVLRAIVCYLYVYIASAIQRRGHTALFWFGACTQVGMTIGGIIIFICTTVLQLFKSAPNC